MRGKFITFEGPDGSGKTTQLGLLAEELLKEGYDVITTREPGGTVIGDKIRKVLLNPEHKNLKEQTEILLYAASRAQLVQELIIPNLNKGKIVLCDRFMDASIAYQAYGLGMERKVVELINYFATSKLSPDRTYLLHVDPETGLKRLKRRFINEFGDSLDRIEQRNIAYHQRVLRGFDSLAEEYPNRIKKIEANQNIEAIFSEIKEDIHRILNQSKGGNLL